MNRFSINRHSLRSALAMSMLAGAVTLVGCASPGGYYSQDAYGQEVYAQGAYSQAVVNPDVYSPGVYNQDVYGRSVYSQGAYSQGSYDPGTYNQDVYRQDLYPDEVYTRGVASPGIYDQSVYSQDSYRQDGYHGGYRQVSDYRSESSACNDCGRITNIVASYDNQSATGVGAVAGAVVGGVLGNQIGSGDGRKAATAVGAVAGGVAGHRIEQNSRGARSYEVHVQLDDGRRFIQRLRDIGNLQVGSYVSVSGGMIREY